MLRQASGILRCPRNCTTVKSQVFTSANRVGRDSKSASEKIKVTSESLQGTNYSSYYLPPNMDDDDDIYSGSSSSESSGDGGKNNGDGNESSGSEMMSLHSDASSDGFNNDAIDVEKTFQLDKLD